MLKQALPRGEGVKKLKKLQYEINEQPHRHLDVKNFNNFIFLRKFVLKALPMFWQLDIKHVKSILTAGVVDSSDSIFNLSFAIFKDRMKT